MRTSVVITAVLITILGAAIGAQADPLYEEHFASDPGWSTDQPSNFRWDPVARDYIATLVNHHEAYQPSRVAYREVASYPGGSFKLEWDQKMTRVDYSAGVNFGLYSANMAHDYWLPNVLATTVNLEYFRHDGGLAIYLRAHDGSGIPNLTYRNANFQLNASYHNSVEYDANAGTVRALITGPGSDFPLTITLSGVGQLPASMNRVGVSRYPFGETGYTGVRESAVAEARIDNILLTPEPASLLPLALGGLAVMRRRRRLLTTESRTP